LAFSGFFLSSGQAPRPDDRKNPENAKEKIDERLDDALEETFPSSDPVSVKVTK